MRRLCVVCEGHSEVEFCKHIIEPYIWNICEDAKTIPITIKTGFSKETGGDCKGGITSFVKAKKEFEGKNFIPYIQLHEFEALVFSDLDKQMLSF